MRKYNSNSKSRTERTDYMILLAVLQCRELAKRHRWRWPAPRKRCAVTVLPYPAFLQRSCACCPLAPPYAASKIRAVHVIDMLLFVLAGRAPLDHGLTKYNAPLHVHLHNFVASTIMYLALALCIASTC